MFKPNLWKIIDESGNVSVPQNLTVAGTLSVAPTVLNTTAIAPPAAPAVTTHGTTGSTTYGYKIAYNLPNGVSLPSPETTITNGTSFLFSTNYNIITVPACPSVPNATINIYLSTPGGNVPTAGLVANVPCGSVFNNTGQNGVSQAPVPTVDTTTGLYSMGTFGLSTTGLNSFWGNVTPLKITDYNTGLSSRDVLMQFDILGSNNSAFSQTAPNSVFFGADGDGIFVMGSKGSNTQFAFLQGTKPEIFDVVSLVDAIPGNSGKPELLIYPSYAHTGPAIEIHDNSATVLWSVDNPTGIEQGGNTQRKITSDYTNATNTPSAFASWSILASKNYSFTCKLYWQESSVLGALALSVLTPTSPTNVEAMAGIYSSNAGTLTSGEITASGGSFTGAVPAVSGTSYQATIAGTVENGTTAGTLAIQAATNGTGTVTLKRGSFCQLY